MAPQRIYRALEGGGVRGIAHIGAAAAFDAVSTHYDVVANVGTSAGADAAALLSAGIAGEQAKEATLAFPFAEVIHDVDSVPIIGAITGGEHLIHDGGLHDGARLERAVAATLKKYANVETFADIDERIKEGVPLTAKLYITGHDVVHGAVVFPDAYWTVYGLTDPAQMSVAFASRASSSIPGFFTPAPITAADGTVSQIADGGIDAILPYDVARQIASERDPGARVINYALGEPPASRSLPAHNPFFGIEYFSQLVRSISSGRRNELMRDPSVLRDTVMIETGGISSTEFNLTRNQQIFLYTSGLVSGLEFVTRDLGTQFDNADRERLGALSESARRDLRTLANAAARGRGDVEITTVMSLTKRLDGLDRQLGSRAAVLG